MQAAVSRLFRVNSNAVISRNPTCTIFEYILMCVGGEKFNHKKVLLGL